MIGILSLQKVFYLIFRVFYLYKPVNYLAIPRLLNRKGAKVGQV
ncbi:MAG: hypothetical protein V4450_03155 [Bacteroidota bacterium]